ncbi:MAG TPA: hypothetical protein VE309_03785 [Caulobacteraceae bacterium]|nr:hypothetical protein [Caulobacteraceae bacterium]
MIAPAAFAQTGHAPGGQGAAPTAPIGPAASQPTAPAQTTDPSAQTTGPSANVGSAANANATVGGTSGDVSATTSTKKKAKHDSVNGSASSGQTTSPGATTAPSNDTSSAPK